jgi:prepilin-type N-terminal cleavage/methylation domain-containing protein
MNFASTDKIGMIGKGKEQLTINHKPLTISRRGYTLIELVVAVGVLVLISAVATDMFVNINRAYNKANAIAKIEQNGNAALNSMVNEIRQARTISPISGTSNTIEIADANGNTITFGFRAPTDVANGCLYRNEAGQCLTDDTLTTGVNVTYLVFTVVDSDPPVVKVEMTITQPKGVAARQDYQARTTLKTSVVLRSYQ